MFMRSRWTRSRAVAVSVTATLGAVTIAVGAQLLSLKETKVSQDDAQAFIVQAASVPAAHALVVAAGGEVRRLHRDPRR